MKHDMTLALWTLYWTVKNFEVFDDEEYSEQDLQCRGNSIHQVSAMDDPHFYARLVNRIADRIWSWRTDVRRRTFPLICDYIAKEELIAYLFGLGIDDDSKPIKCLQHGCGVPLRKYFILLWDESSNMPYEYFHMCTLCAHRTRTYNRQVAIKEIDCKIFRWRSDPNNPDSIPAYVHRYFCNNLSCVLTDYRSLDNFDIKTRISMTSLLDYVETHYSHIVKGLCRKGGLRKHLTFVFGVVAYMSSERYVPCFLVILKYFHCRLAASKKASEIDWDTRISRLKAVFPDLQNTLCEITGSNRSIRDEMPEDHRDLVETDICKILSLLPPRQVLRFVDQDSSELLPHLRFLFGHWLGIEKAVELTT